jgi:hypothetical protein
VHYYFLDPALQCCSGSDGERFVDVRRPGSLRKELYAPEGRGPQLRHAPDALCFDPRGSGEFVQDATRHRSLTSDALCVPAGQPHPLENFSDDFATWVAI